MQNGDIVDIITSKTGRPSLDWLNIVGSSESKSKIRNWFKRENKAENIEKGIMQGDVGEAVDIYEKYWNKLKTN